MSGRGGRGSGEVQESLDDLSVLGALPRHLRRLLRWGGDNDAKIDDPSDPGRGTT